MICLECIERIMVCRAVRAVPCQAEAQGVTQPLESTVAQQSGVVGTANGTANVAGVHETGVASGDVGRRRTSAPDLLLPPLVCQASLHVRLHEGRGLSACHLWNACASVCILNEVEMRFRISFAITFSSHD